MTQTATALIASYNKIVKMDSFPAMASLVLLDLGYNSMNQFPNLTNVGTTLKTLYLNDQNINYVAPERLDALTALETLRLAGNELTSIPDVSGPSGSLTQLLIARNSFSIFPTLYNLSKSLTLLNLRYNNIKHFTIEHTSAKFN